MNSRTPFAVVLCGIVTVSLFAPGCKTIARKITERAIEKGTGAKEVDLENGKIEVRGSSGGVMASGPNVQLPDNWPSYLPSYPGATLTTTFLNPQNNGASATMMTTDSSDVVMAFYKTKLTAAGFTSQGAANIAGMQTATYKKAKTSAVVTVMPAQGKQMISLTGSEAP